MAIARSNTCSTLFVDLSKAKLLLFVNSKFQSNSYNKNYFRFFKAKLMVESKSEAKI